MLLADEKQSVYQFKGTHFMASYVGCDDAALRDVQRLAEAMCHAVDACGAHRLNEVHHVFPPDGLTMLILLSESHASIHTYPEYQACFVDLFTCGDTCSFERFDRALQEYLQPKQVSSKVLLRQKESQDAAMVGKIEPLLGQCRDILPAKCLAPPNRTG